MTDLDAGADTDQERDPLDDDAVQAALEYRHLQEAYRTGVDIRAALREPFIKWLIGYFETRAAVAQEKLCKVDPFDGKAVMMLQNEVKTFLAIESGIKRAIGAAERALDRMAELEQE